MFVYITGAKESKNPKHTMFVTPGALVPRGSEVPSEWKNEDGSLKQFAVDFVYGRASVESQLGELLVKTGHAQRSSKLVRATTSMLSNLARTLQGRPATA